MTINICFPFVGDSVGGSHISALLLIEALQGTIYRPIVVLHEDGPLATHLKQRRIAYEFVPIPAFAGASARLADIAAAGARSCRPLAKFIRSRQIAIVHANDLRMNLTWVMPARVTGARLVWHQRTMPFSKSALWRLVPRLASRALAISHAVANALRLPASAVVYNPFGEAMGKPVRADCRAGLQRELGLPPDAILLGAVGRIVRSKRPDLCLEILARLVSRLPQPTHFVFIGQDAGGLEAGLRRRASELALSAHVHFLGFRFPIDKDLAALDLILAPSETEGFGRAIVEAQLAGTPVVASDIEAHREIVTDERLGRIVPRGDAEAFAAAALQHLDAPPAGRASAQAALAARFSREAHVRSIIMVYDDLMGRRAEHKAA